MDLPHPIADLHVIEHPPSWRPAPLTVSFLTLSENVTGADLLHVYQWARDAGLANPRVISPAHLAWCSVFHPRFFEAAQRWSSQPLSSIGLPPGHFLNDWDRRERFRAQSVVFLASVTLSAAIIQSRWSRGTIASKLDKLWQAGDPDRPDVASQLQGIDLRREVRRLAAANPGPDLLLRIKHLFADVLQVLACDIHADRVLMRPAKLSPQLAARFGFVESLLDTVAKIQSIIVYGSSVSSAHFADYDIVLVVADADAALQALCGAAPSFDGKELNISIYTADELWIMQLLSGDNLADYGLCLYGEAVLPQKSTDLLLVRNFSFGMIRQRQQLGMIPSAQASTCDPRDDRHNLHSYFVKIPVNVVKDSFGAVGRRWSKEKVHDWLRERCDFDPALAQDAASGEGLALALARSAVATMDSLLQLNSELAVVHPCA